MEKVGESSVYRYQLEHDGMHRAIDFSMVSAVYTDDDGSVLVRVSGKGFYLPEDVTFDEAINLMVAAR